MGAVKAFDLDIVVQQGDLRVFDPEALVRERMMAQARQSQELILRGSNSITYDGSNGSTVVLEAPKWHKRPVDRIRLVWARWRYRRAYLLTLHP
jgi:hypothetical protein